MVPIGILALIVNFVYAIINQFYLSGTIANLKKVQVHQQSELKVLLNCVSLDKPIDTEKFYLGETLAMTELLGLRKEHLFFELLLNIPYLIGMGWLVLRHYKRKNEPPQTRAARTARQQEVEFDRLAPNPSRQYLQQRELER